MDGVLGQHVFCDIETHGALAGILQCQEGLAHAPRHTLTTVHQRHCSGLARCIGRPAVCADGMWVAVGVCWVSTEPISKAGMYIP